MKVFVDTGAFIALTDADDENHKTAAAFYRNAKEKGTRFVTTNLVACETMNFLRARISHPIAILFWENLKKSGFIEIVTVTPSIEDGAFAIFKRYADKDFSFTDCTSFSVMRSLRLRSAFAFDKHFEQFEGIGRLP
ncbi:MAG TPA: PIN domain-containing protein [Thermodesulfobacteriota bacterium]|nr:PIN domain-containing protein [Thermodesulfobacteriota bacterium]